MYFLIGETLKECSFEDCMGETPYVAVLDPKEWQNRRESFAMGIDVEPDEGEIYNTKAEVNYDSLTGTFSVPDRSDVCGEDKTFSFALDERGIVFIDQTGAAAEIIKNVQRTKKWRFPSLERFLYDFLEQIIHGDLRLLEIYEKRLDAAEKAILSGGDESDLVGIYDVCAELIDLRIHYDQLMDMGQELEENENHFFKSENTRYFRLFTGRVERLYNEATALRDYAMQLRALYQSQLDIKQNRIMTILTVVTTIFMPLTLIAGWYGMNFRYMPELEYRWSYPIVIAVSIAIVIISLIIFRKKKWL